MTGKNWIKVNGLARAEALKKQSHICFDPGTANSHNNKLNIKISG